MHLYPIIHASSNKCIVFLFRNTATCIIPTAFWALPPDVRLRWGQGSSFAWVPLLIIGILLSCSTVAEVAGHVSLFSLSPSPMTRLTLIVATLHLNVACYYQNRYLLTFKLFTHKIIIFFSQNCRRWRGYSQFTNRSSNKELLVTRIELKLKLNQQHTFINWTKSTNSWKCINLEHKYPRK